MIDIVAGNGYLQGMSAEELLMCDHFIDFGIVPALTFSALCRGRGCNGLPQNVDGSDGLLGLGESRYLVRSPFVEDDNRPLPASERAVVST
ncbi:hypothetical protein [Mesorhizobium sp. WSM3224]|uniref:hypothetical protein n=1 Tax=Mesorhizobium sp. WSM3224 TaxID=1040986 RepID=UPI0012EB7971|nr:hypothetical protein [Mesorhizobium sp. WSM3224]